MIIDILGLKAEMVPLPPIPTDHPHAREFRADIREVYFWNCREQKGEPRNRPAKISMGPRLRPMPQYSYARPIRTSKANLAARMKPILKHMGVELKDLERGLRKAWGGKSVKVPYATLIDPFKLSDTRVLYATQTYARWKVRFQLPGAAAMQPTYDFFAMMPLSIRFHTRTHNYCEGFVGEEWWFQETSEIVEIKLKPKGKERLDQHTAELSERAKKEGKLLPPGPDDQDAPADPKAEKDPKAPK